MIFLIHAEISLMIWNSLTTIHRYSLPNKKNSQYVGYTTDFRARLSVAALAMEERTQS